MLSIFQNKNIKYYENQKMNYYGWDYLRKALARIVTFSFNYILCCYYNTSLHKTESLFHHIALLKTVILINYKPTQRVLLVWCLPEFLVQKVPNDFSLIFLFFMLFSLLTDMYCHFAFKRKFLTILIAFPTYFSFLNSLQSGMKYGP